MKLLQKKFDYVVEEHIYLEPKLKERKLLKMGLILFIVYLSLHAIQVFGVAELSLNFITLLLAFIFFVAFPINYKREFRKGYMIITTDMIFQRVDQNQYVMIHYADITGFDHDDNCIYISHNEDVISIDLDKYNGHIAQVVDLLEAMGKTFDKDKDFMIRPIHVYIKDDALMFDDVKEEETKTESLTFDLLKEYDSVTPGYFNQVIPRNSTIYEAYIKDNNLYMELSHIEVNSDHPENTSFNMIKVKDAIMVFEDVKINALSKREENERKSPYNKLDASTEIFLNEIQKGVVSEWKFKQGEADFVFAVGVGGLKVNMTFNEIIVGWK